LPFVLRRGNKEYETQRLINSTLDSLYGARCETLIRKKGEVQIFGLYMDMLDNKYTLNNEDIFKSGAEFICKLVLDPKISEGGFTEDYVISEKNNLKDYIASQINDKRSYSLLRCYEEMCKNEAYALSEYGRIEDLDTFNNKDLYEHYKNIISQAQIEIFYIGSIDENTVIDVFKENFSKIQRKPDEKMQTEVIESVSEVKEIIQKMEVAQGKLCIGYRIGSLMSDKDYCTMVLTNEIFGGSPTSKLFINVREKLSLCYYVASRIDRLKGIMIVYSGIENKNKQVAIEEIDKQLMDVKNGSISQDELTAAKRSVKNSIKSTFDSAFLSENYYLSQVLSESKMEPSKFIEIIDAITIQEIKNMSNNIKKDTIYFLEGIPSKKEDK
jgi:predicted Zn-dependent peptidase